MAGFAALLPALTKGAKFGKAALSIASMFGGGGLTPAQQQAVAAQNQAMAQWFSDRNRYDNKGIELKLSQNANTIGFSRGKGDLQRESDTPKEIYDLNYDLAFGKITKEEHTKRVKEFWENQ